MKGMPSQAVIMRLDPLHLMVVSMTHIHSNNLIYSSNFILVVELFEL